MMGRIRNLGEDPKRFEIVKSVGLTPDKQKG
jgi:hypothetical protein